VRKALAALPWVEPGTIHMNFKKRELTFGIKGKSQFNEAAVKDALNDQGFPNAEVKDGPT
jgi:hypothetical protein